MSRSGKLALGTALTLYRTARSSPISPFIGTYATEKWSIAFLFYKICPDASLKQTGRFYFDWLHPIATHIASLIGKKDY
jgi:hypothetical protein